MSILPSLKKLATDQQHQLPELLKSLEEDGISVKEFYSEQTRQFTICGLDRKTGMQYQHQIDLDTARNDYHAVTWILQTMRHQLMGERQRIMGTDWTSTDAGAVAAPPSYAKMKMYASAASSSGTAWVQVRSENDYFTGLDPVRGRKPVRRFNRINRLVEIDEGATFEEPLDKLRLDVFKWLGR